MLMRGVPPNTLRQPTNVGGDVARMLNTRAQHPEARLCGALTSSYASASPPVGGRPRPRREVGHDSRGNISADRFPSKPTGMLVRARCAKQNLTNSKPFVGNCFTLGIPFKEHLSSCRLNYSVDPEFALVLLEVKSYSQRDQPLDRGFQ